MMIVVVVSGRVQIDSFGKPVRVHAAVVCIKLHRADHPSHQRGWEKCPSKSTAANGAVWAHPGQHSSQLHDGLIAHLPLKVRLLKAEAVEAVLHGCTGTSFLAKKRQQWLLYGVEVNDAHDHCGGKRGHMTS